MRSIAERFKDTYCNLQVPEYIRNSIYNWLQQQPENNYSGNPNSSKNFTLAEVEAIAREAVANADINERDDCADFNAWWWRNKEQEWIK